MAEQRGIQLLNHQLHPTALSCNLSEVLPRAWHNSSCPVQEGELGAIRLFCHKHPEDKCSQVCFHTQLPPNGPGADNTGDSPSEARRASSKIQKCFVVER